jgi:hypothetical protein
MAKEVLKSADGAVNSVPQTHQGKIETMRLALLIAGVLLVLVGAVWIGQGVGYFPYPSSSFMIDDIKWAYAGSALLVFGLLLIASGRRGR